MRDPRIQDDTIGASAVSQFQLVKTAGALVVTTAKTEDAVGIVQSDYDANAANAAVATSGPTPAIAAAAISKGDELMPAASGRVATHDGLSGSKKVGRAEEAASGAGAYLDIILYDDKTNAT